MEATELRIGNWVKDHGESGEHYQVREIGEDMFSAGPMIVYPAGMDYEYGIPLTEEWLLKFGFNKSHNLFYTDYYFTVEANNDGKFEYGFENYQVAIPSIKLEYVHQLQNLYFALTGEELNIIT